MMDRAVIALGSNIEPEAHIQSAIEAIDHAFSLLKTSEFIYTEPVIRKNQPDFLNGAALIETDKDDSEITAMLKQIEQKLGRQKTADRNAPRKIDLDLVLFNEKIMDDDVFERDFLRRSIQEVLPDFELVK